MQQKFLTKEMNPLSLWTPTNENDTAYDFVTDEQRPLLDQLLACVPAAKRVFEKGDVPTAFRLLNANKCTQLRPEVGITKFAFLMIVEDQMPNKYCP